MKQSFSKAFIANTVTSLNVFCGFLSLLYASQHDFQMAAVFIIVAAIFDAFDGIVARLLGTSSRFGVELDSLSDVVSFGAAPAFLIYKAYAFQLGVAGIVLSSLLLIFGALRLARFNLSVEDLNTKSDFSGLPIPVSAITVALLVFSFHKDGSLVFPYNYIAAPLVIGLAILMVSKIRYNALPKMKDKNFKQKILFIVTLLVALVLTFLTDGVIVFFIFLGMVLFGVLRALYYLIAGSKDEIENEIKVSEN
ncbi:MAG: CDP-diacylglycerol--serine O-phosphatidyltransferase [Ignavibacteriales bacterium]|nr:CDP-diacylglycerol--serine O-phosphatidyltransferase [Ignavibacteriales bacterium]OGU69807.1 MAG: CDP-diacylglycerol--serine O-phosphatidyltransferase [Stygiobacter sp. GWC2_38_9]OGV08387.1 MAG: CDP-diacylglycerol--serine O-phosphatidyltransferase [Stygiobacter sp. RIFOXYB2_FULL_37_11]OGV14933.1 MAG: CDP-diacylglycerol--serine O-phosphatidyltransferase [Stygiobacter sp. RIFOXYC2_FULL_38_25]OGV17138.1 MAG: CDP-diacylglycerol--serine O-phosphatidyltransferase [Stygiobacter sp. RIFOXYA2_FULL_38